MFRVRVVGIYIARSDVMEKEKVKKNYEIEGNIPHLTAALSIVKNKLLGPALTKKYSDYVTYLTYHIIEITPLTEDAKQQMNKSEVNFMDRPSLIQFIKEHALPVDASYYPNLFRLREAVQFAKEDPKGYTKHFTLREKDLRLDLEMAQCNPDLFEKKEEADFVASVNNIPKPKKAAKAAAHAKKTEDRLDGLKAEQIKDGDMGPLDSVPDTGDL